MPSDKLLSLFRRRTLTIEARAERMIVDATATIPRQSRQRWLVESDPVLLGYSDQCDRVRESLWQSKFMNRPWLERGVDVRSSRQIRFGRRSVVRSGTILNGRSSCADVGIVAGDDLYIKENAYLDAYGGKIVIGRGAALAQGVVLHGNGGIVLGNYVMMGHGAMVLAGNHNYGLTELPFMFQGSVSSGVNIGNNVWLGAGATVLDGVDIGDNVVVGAGSVVSRDLPSNSLAFGGRELVVRELAVE